MEKTEAFYDFCIPYNKDVKVMRSMMKELIELGYKTIAIEQVYDHTKKETKRRGEEAFPEPIDITSIQDEFKPQLKILQRITIKYADPAISHAMSISTNLKKFHLIAGQPTTDAALNHCCTTFYGDLLCFDVESGAKLMVNRKAYNIGVKRGLYFEIKYSVAIRDSNNRKDMIKIAHNYYTRGKSKNIIFSSGALTPFELRSPYDVANLSFIFGLSEDQGKNGVDRSCRQLFLRAESRRIGKTIMLVKSKGPITFPKNIFEEDSENSSDHTDSAKDIEMHSSSNDEQEPSESKGEITTEPLNKRFKPL